MTHYTYGWKYAHCCRFPFVQCDAPVPSVISHRLPCPHNPPHGHSSQCHSNADSGPWSGMVISSLCVCVLIRVCMYLGGSVRIFLNVCFWGHPCTFFSILGCCCLVHPHPTPFPEDSSGNMKVCWCSDRVRRDRTTRQRGEVWGAQQHEQAEGKEDSSAF